MVIDSGLKRCFIVKTFSHPCVLIHVNGVTNDVIDSDYFAALVDANALLHPSKPQASLF